MKGTLVSSCFTSDCGFRTSLCDKYRKRNSFYSRAKILKEASRLCSSHCTFRNNSLPNRFFLIKPLTGRAGADIVSNNSLLTTILVHFLFQLWKVSVST